MLRPNLTSPLDFFLHTLQLFLGTGEHLGSILVAKNGTYHRGDKCHFAHEAPAEYNNEGMNDMPDVAVVAPMTV